MYLKSLISLFYFLSIGQAHGAIEVVRAETCAKPQGDEVIVHRSDFQWNQELSEIKERAERLYKEGKRLDRRAYLREDGKVVIPHSVPSNGEQEIELTERFLQSIRLHIEKGLELRYVDSITFSDMGHSHFFIPQDFFNQEIAPLPVSQQHIAYQKMLAHEGLKILYHTAEQLKMLEEDRSLVKDRHIQWRYFTRNLVGDNQAQGNMELIHQEDHSYNTARDYKTGYRYWGAGFYLTANKDGCFPFKHKGETYYFDINLRGFEM